MIERQEEGFDQFLHDALGLPVFVARLITARRLTKTDEVSK